MIGQILTPLLLLICSALCATDIEELDNRRALFTSEGTLVLTNSYAHLTLNFKLSKLEDRISIIMLIRAQLNAIKITATWPPNLNQQQRNRLSSRLHFVAHYVNVTTADVVIRVNNILESVGSDPLSDNPSDYHHLLIAGTAKADARRRQPRQIIVAGVSLLAGLIGGAVSSLFSSSTLASIVKEKTDVIAHTVSDNILAINSNSRELQALNRSVDALKEALINQMYKEGTLQLETTLLTITTTVGIISTDLHNICDSVQKAKGGRLALESIDATGLTEHLETLKIKTNSAGYKLTASQISDLDRVQTSYLVTEDSLHLILHIPIYIPKSELTLHRYIPTPILMDYNLNTTPVVYLSVSPKQTYIGIDSSRTTFVELSTDELSLCLHYRSKEFFCPHLSRLKEDAPSCIYSLFTNDKSRIPRLCKAQYTTSAFQLQRLSMSTWMITSTRQEKVFITCPTLTPIEQVLQGTYLLTLSKGCTATSPTFLIERPAFEPDLSYDANFTTSPIIDPNLFTIEANITAQNVLDLINHTQATIESTDVYRFRRFQQQIDSIEERYNPLGLGSLVIHSGSSFITLFVIFAIIALAALIIYRRYRQKPTLGTETTFWFRGTPRQPQREGRAGNAPINARILEDIPPLDETPTHDPEAFDPEVNPPDYTPSPIANHRRTTSTHVTTAPMTSTQDIPPLAAALTRYDRPPAPVPLPRYDIPPQPQPVPSAELTGTRPKATLTTGTPTSANLPTLVYPDSLQPLLTQPNTGGK